MCMTLCLSPDGGADRSAAGGQAAGPPNPQTISSNL